MFFTTEANHPQYQINALPEIEHSLVNQQSMIDQQLLIVIISSDINKKEVKGQTI